MAGCANFLSTSAPNQENMDSLFDITVSKRVDGVTSRSISTRIFLVNFLSCWPALPARKRKTKSKTNLENVSCNAVV